MQIDKLTDTDAFVVVDIETADQAVGVVRAARKVLQGSAIALARSMTYAFASRGLKISGASAGISAEDSARAEALEAFVAEVQPRVESGSLVLDPFTGVDADALDAFRAHDPRHPVRRERVEGLEVGAHLAPLGAVVAADAALGGLDGKTAAVELGPGSDRLVAELVARGARVVAAGSHQGTAVDPAGLSTDALVSRGAAGLADLGELGDAAALVAAPATVLFCGSRQGMIDGPTAEALEVELVVPTGCQPVSAKGLAVLRRRGIVALADFVTTSGATYAGWPAGDATVEAVTADAAESIAAQVRDDLTNEEGPLLGACSRAEAFLGTWLETLPFGRPLA